MPEKKILHILYSGQGGLGTYFMNFVNSDQEKQFEHFAFFYGIEVLNPELEAFCDEHNIPYQYQPKQSKIDFKALGTVLRFRKKNQIQYLFLHTFSLSLLTLISLVKRWKVIAFDHTTLAYKTTIEKIFTVFNHLFAYKMIYFYKGHFEQNKNKFPFLRFGKNSHIIPKTVNIHFFKPAENKPNNIHFTLGITARLIQGKRHDLILKALTHLRNKGVIIYLKIAGSGPKMVELKRLVDELNLSQQVEFTGLLNRNQLVDFYQSLDAYIHASKGETICYSIMEAQACGLPILASDVEGIYNTLQKNEGGILFSNKVEYVADKIKILIKEPELINELRTASLKAAEKRYKRFNNPEIFNTILLSKI